MSRRRSCDKELTVYSLFWLWPVVDDEKQIDGKHLGGSALRAQFYAASQTNSNHTTPLHATQSATFMHLGALTHWKHGHMQTPIDDDTLPVWTRAVPWNHSSFTKTPGKMFAQSSEPTGFFCFLFFPTGGKTHKLSLRPIFCCPIRSILIFTVWWEWMLISGGVAGGVRGVGRLGFPTWWIKLLYYIFQLSLSHKISPPFEVWWISEWQTQTDLLLLVLHYNEKLTEEKKTITRILNRSISFYF